MKQTWKNWLNIVGGMLVASFVNGQAEAYPEAELSAWRAPYAGEDQPSTCRDNGETLVFSDSPEYVRGEGLLCQGTIDGHGRLYFYHVNGSPRPMQLVVYALSETTGAAVGVTREVIGTPDSFYTRHGREVSRKELFASATQRVLRLTEGRPELLLQEERIVVQPGELISGILDLETSAPVKVRVAMLGTSRTALHRLAYLPPLEHDAAHDRGTFPATARKIELAPYRPDRDGMRVIHLADGTRDPYLIGRDEITGREVTLRGNYGMTYTIKIPLIGLGPVDLFFNPQGGGYAGDMSIEVNGRWRPISLAGHYQKRAIGTDTVQDTIHLGTFPTETTVTVTWTPAGASFLPVRICLVPHAMGASQAAREQESN